MTEGCKLHDEGEAGAASLLPPRQALMQVCAAASAEELRAAIASCVGFDESAVRDVRPPEIGMVMVRGRVGGDGGPFNLGEATVTRAAVRLPCGMVGHSYLLGRVPERARLAAIVDALGQQAGPRAGLEASLVAPVRARIAGQRAARQAETAGTRVNFFTLVRGED